MICALACCEKDLFLARELLGWIGDLGGCPAHDLTLIVDEATPWHDVLELMSASRAHFRSTKLVCSPTKAGWPAGPNQMFRTCATALRDECFLWLEPDCVPICPGWLDRIEDAYVQCGQPFMGAIMHANGDPTIPMRSLNGNAVYPCRAIDLIGPGMNERQAWEMTSAALVMPQAAETPLIQNFWGKPDLAPTFVKHRTPRSPINAFTLDNIKEQTVLFHRCKDGSLIRVLRDTIFPGQQQKTLRVVFPFHNGDGALLAKMLEFSAWLCGSQQPFEACVSYDNSASPHLTLNVMRAARSAFKQVTEIRYPVPEHKGWPYAANLAFQHAADFMSQSHSPWLWCEADAVPLTPDWLHVLDYEYRRRNKLFFGPIVPGRGHMNGVGIYPPHTPQVAPRAMQSQWGAWDWDMKPDMIHLCYDASHLIQHCWGIVNNQPHPYEGGAASFDSKAKLGWLLTSAVLFHRCKDGSLIERLREL